MCIRDSNIHTHTRTRLTTLFSGLPRWAGTTQKGKTNLDFTVARDSEWQWHQLSHMQVCISLQADNHASTPPLSFLQAGCPFCRPTNSVKALKALAQHMFLHKQVYRAPKVVQNLTPVVLCTVGYLVLFVLGRLFSWLPIIFWCRMI